jgi:hypothetical protein
LRVFQNIQLFSLLPVFAGAGLPPIFHFHLQEKLALHYCREQ